jgi:hypothetical protein
MEAYGFLSSFPISCQRNGRKRLEVKDGQHRLIFAEALGLPVYYVVEEQDYDIAEVNSTAKIWTLIDYAQKHADNGRKPYQEGLAFAQTHGLPVGAAFCLLAGTTTFGNISDKFCAGEFAIKDREWADRVASTYSAMIVIADHLRNKRFLEALMAVCRVDEFESPRLIRVAKRCMEKLGSYSTRDGYLEMLEEVYNFQQRRLFPLRIKALEALRERSFATKKSQ